MVSNWKKHDKIHRLLNSPTEEKSKHQHMLEKFDKLSKKNSSSVRDLVTLAAQIVHPQPELEEGNFCGYWSNPEDQVVRALPNHWRLG